MRWAFRLGKRGSSNRDDRDRCVLNILHVIPSLKQASGPTAFCVEVSDRLTDDKTHVTILYGGEVDATCCVPKNPQVRLVKDWAGVSQGARLDLVHIHSLWAPLSHAGAQWARKNRIPYVVSAHGMLAPWAMRHKWLKKRLAWWLYQRRDLKSAAMFHVTAECEVKWLRDLGFQQPCLLAPLGSDLPELSSSTAQRREGVKTVLFVGRIYPVKGLMNLVRAWAQVSSARVRECESSKVGEDAVENGASTEKLRTSELQNSRTSPWQLVIAGPDQAGHKAELVAEARRLGMTVADVTTNELMRFRTHALLPDLVFTGPVYGEEKDALYRLADLFVLPSFTENFGVVVTDALSYGIPVITTKGTPWAELLGSPASSKVLKCGSSKVRESASGQSAVAVGSRHAHAVCQENFRTLEFSNFSTAFGRCGWWIDIGVLPLVSALQEALSISDRERGLMGECGRRLVREKYGWRAISESTRCAYEWLLHGGPPPPSVTR